MTTKGVRLNNPGNIEHGQNWVGLTPTRLDPRFCSFVAPQYGIRAIHLILQAYAKKYGIRTIEGIISRWAPPSENNTEAYIRHVDDIVLGADRDDVLDILDPTIAFQLVSGIIAHENSNYKYEESIVWEGLKMAGVKLPHFQSRPGSIVGV